MRIDEGGRVGIGITNGHVLSNSLEVEGTIKTTQLDVTTLNISNTLALASVNITGGSIDGTAIGANTKAAGIFTDLTIDNLKMDDNIISSLDTNGDITMTPNGTGSVVISKVDINGGIIDGTAIGTNAKAAGGFTDLTVDNLKMDTNIISSLDTNGDITMTPNGTGSVVISKVDINGGTIDGAAIGTTTKAAGAFTDLTVDNLNLNDNIISSLDTNGNITIAPNGVGSVVISKVDINGGTIDGTAIGATTKACLLYTSPSPRD